MDVQDFHRQPASYKLEWALATGLLIFILAFLLLPFHQNRHKAGTPQCKRNLKQIGLALHNYNADYGCLPPAFLTDPQGAPTLSWRVLILPYLDESALFHRFNLDQRWDSPENIKLLSEMPSVFRCPRHAENDRKPLKETHYLVPVGAETAFPYAECVPIRDIKDGTSNCLLVVEDPEFSVPWSAPTDVTAGDWISHLAATHRKVSHTDGQFVLVGDGTVRFLRYDTAPKTLHALLSISDGAPVGPF